MVKDDKVKITDDKRKKKTSELGKQFNDSEISSNNTRVDESLQFVNKRPWLNLTLRYIAAVMVVVLAFWLYYVMTALFGPGLPTYILFYPAIIIVALLAGFGPGILATIISVLLAVIWILPPVGQFAITSAINGVGVVIFSNFWCNNKQRIRTLSKKSCQSRSI